ncbi:MAG TPA: PAS domain S-box protein, partial [Azospirillaceae bacterium]|nr:PAS domain S-box protein [Azospirillaceae bacterium]
MKGSFRFGMTFRLVGGLLAMAVLTVAASTMAMISFESFRKTFDQVASQQLETMVVAAQLGQQSETIISHAPALLLAETDWQRMDVAFVAADQQSWLSELVHRLAKTLQDRASIDAIEANKLALVENITALDQQVARRILAEEGLRQAIGQFKTLYDLILTRVDQEESRLSGAAAAPAAEARRATDGMPVVPVVAAKPMLAVVEDFDREMDFVSINTVLAISLRDPARSAAFQAEAGRHLGRLGELVEQLPAGDFGDTLRGHHQKLTDLLTGAEGLFPLLGRTAAYRSESQALMEANRDIAAVLTTSVGNLMSVVRSDILQKNHYFNQTLATRSQLLTLLATLCVLGAVAIAAYIHFSVIRRLNHLQHCIRAQVAGQAVPVPIDGTDEIGEMARAVDYFITEIRRREQALRDSESRFRGLIEGSIQGIMIHREFKPLFANEAYARYFGFASAEEVLALGSIEPFLMPEEMPRARRNYERLMAGERRLEVQRVRNRRKDGTPIWLDVFDRVVEWMGEKVVQVTVVDVTDHVRAEREAAEKTVQLEAAFDAMPSGICMFDRDLKVVVQNQQFLDLWGFDGEFLKYDPTLPALLRRAVELSDASGAGVDTETMVGSLLSSIQASKRITFEVQLPGSRILEIRGSRRPEGGFVFTFTDVTERRRAEEARRTSEARFRDLIEGAIQGMVIATYDGDILFANQSFADILGYDSPEEVVALGSLLPLIGPEDRPRVAGFGQSRKAGQP